MKVVFHTLGCKLNYAETSHLMDDLARCGFTEAKDGEAADLIVVNTCAVTQVAERKGRAVIKQLAGKNPDAFVVVVGCYAQIKPEDLKQIECVDLIVGAEHKFDVPTIIREMELKKHGEARVVHTTRNDVNVFFPFCASGDRTRFLLKVQDGCDYFCAYCTVPIARGKSRNASVRDTVCVAEQAARNGAREIVISGVNIGDFGKTTGETFFDLIKELDRVEGLERYRISSIEPNLLTNDIIDFVANSRSFMPHFHIPLQSGCDKVLEMMHRRYKRDVFAEKVRLIKTAMPDAFIGVDVISGFNGETDGDFMETYSFLQSLDITRLHVFPYSPRPNTAALGIKPYITASVKKERTERLIALSDKKLGSFYSAQKGRTAKILWEESGDKKYMHGFSENYIRCRARYDAELINKVQTVVLGDIIEEGECIEAVPV